MFKKIIFFLWAGCMAAAQGITAPMPDFLVSDIVARGDQFIYIKLENRAPVDCAIKPELYEKIFLTIYINNLKRAEYKVKYIDKALFRKKGIIFFRTNLRVKNPLKIKAEINGAGIVPESNYLNNSLEKTFNR